MAHLSQVFRMSYVALLPLLFSLRRSVASSLRRYTLSVGGDASLVFWFIIDAV
jgi:hypothetical protein